jgi:hypothetical protein
VSRPSQSPFSDDILHQSLLGEFSDPHIRDFVLPRDVQDLPEPPVMSSFQLLGGCLLHWPCLSSI